MSSPYDLFAVSMADNYTYTNNNNNGHEEDNDPSLDDISKRLQLVDERVAKYIMNREPALAGSDPKVLADHIRAYCLVNMTLNQREDLPDETVQQADEFYQVMKRTSRGDMDHLAVREMLVRIIVKILFGLYS
jgi:hypothetical protein